MPICTYSTKSGNATIERLVGTAFLISSDGFFITASHVVTEAQAIVEGTASRIGIVGKDDNGKSTKSIVAQLEWYHTAPEPYDITLGHSAYMSETPFRLSDREVSVWQDVATYGYPVSAIGGDISGLRLNLRAQKGYVQRTTAPSDMHIGNHPNGLELSFLVSPGLSGAPIFINHKDHMEVIAVAVASYKTETTEAELVEVLDDGAEYRERILRIEQFGFAHSLAGLKGWKHDGISPFERSSQNRDATGELIGGVAASLPED
ncbi:S1 family peptidase [Devosia insulae]|nr:serine protease [Devosia insulae]